MEKAFFKRVLGKPRDCHQKLHKPYYKVFYLRPYPSFHSSCPLFVFVFHSFHSTTNLSFQEWKKYSAWEPLISTAQGVVQPHNTPEYCAYRSHCSPFPLLTTTLLLQRKCYDFRASERTSSLETKLAPPGNLEPQIVRDSCAYLRYWCLHLFSIKDGSLELEIVATTRRVQSIRKDEYLGEILTRCP